MRSRRVALSVAAVLLSATGLLVALLAPGRVSAAQHDANAERAAKPIAPSAAAVTKHVDSGMPLDEGTTLLPASGDTQLPATPDTPRPHYVRPPAHLP